MLGCLKVLPVILILLKVAHKIVNTTIQILNYVSIHVLRNPNSIKTIFSKF